MAKKKKLVGWTNDFWIEKLQQFPTNFCFSVNKKDFFFKTVKVKITIEDKKVTIEEVSDGNRYREVGLGYNT